MNRSDVDSYLADGCGRCDLYKTPECKVHRWTKPLQAMREVLLSSSLTEEMKWGAPCYTSEGKNVVMLSALKDKCVLSFFKGALLSDTHGLLRAPGANSQAARQFEFTTAAQVRQHRALVAQYIEEAIEAERAGLKVAFKKAPEPMPEELQQVLDSDAALQAAFAALTPGRQRSYILHVSGAKQAKTRANRAEKCIPKIFAGKGFNER